MINATKAVRLEVQRSRASARARTRAYAKGWHDAQKLAASIAGAYLHVVTEEEIERVTPAAYSNGTVMLIIARLREMKPKQATP